MVAVVGVYRQKSTPYYGPNDNQISGRVKVKKRNFVRRI